MKVSLVIPAHNEESRLNTALDLYSQSLSEQYHDSFEILVVANGCKDQTSQAAQEYASRCSQVNVIDIPEPIGKGAAVMEGFRQASGEKIAFVDADGSTLPASLLILLQQLDNMDVAIGSRWLESSLIIHPQPLTRRICSRLFNLSIRLLFHLPYHDTQCGAKAFRRAAAKKLTKVVRESRWTFDVDLLLWAGFFHLRVAEVPVIWVDQPGSKLKYGPTSLEVLSSLRRLKQRKMESVWINDLSNAHEEVRL